MARTREVAILLTATLLLSLVGAGVAGAKGGSLKPTPPNALPAHKQANRHHGAPAPKHHPGAQSGLPITGVDTGVEVAVALLLFGFGAFGKGFSDARPALGDRRP
jgi:hypothetical protein